MRRSPFPLPLVLLSLLVAGCGGDGGSTPTSPAAPHVELATADVVVDGQVLNGQTVPMHQGGGPTRFEARMELDGGPLSGGVVYCQYDRPGGMGMHGHGTFAMYDDGTHGDHTAGDGIYCYEDDREEYGCHGSGAGPGEYHYEFWGHHAAFGDSAHRRVTVTVR